VIVATVALALLLAPMLLVALAIRSTSRGPALYGQMRIGQGGRPFRVLKFRTMRRDSSGSALTVPGDTRVTRLGRVLRATCIDELPQLLNVLMGQMTLVGPRPQTPGFAAEYPPDLRVIFRYRPGVTGPGVITFNDEDTLPPATATTDEIEAFYLENVVPRRVAVDLEFCRNATVGRTVRVLWQTVLTARHRFCARKPEQQRVITLPDSRYEPADFTGTAAEVAEQRSQAG